MKLKILLSIIIILAIVGVADSSYALQQHYAPPDTSSCDFNETISCTAINQSEYSVFLGVPVAIFGIAGYLLIAGLALAILLQYRKRQASWLLLAAVIPALAFSLWLTWIEIFVLEAVCPLCAISLVLITVITVLTLFVAVQTLKKGQ